MHLIKYIIEYDGTATINHEYTAEISKNRPLVLEWFAGHAISVDFPHQTIKINDKTFIIRPRPTPEKQENKERKEGIEKLHTVLGHARITNKKESYIALNSNFQLSTFNFQLHELPFAFLQCVQYGDLENARAMLSFDITDQSLRDYFGEFEVLLNNYLDEPNAVSVLPKDSDTAKTFRFQIEGGKISNIS